MIVLTVKSVFVVIVFGQFNTIISTFTNSSSSLYVAAVCLLHPFNNETINTDKIDFLIISYHLAVY